MIGIDWVAVVVLGVAWAFTTVRTVPLSARHAVFGLACLGIAAYRFVRGVAGLNLIVALVAAVFGVQYLWKAWQAYKTATTPRE